jgi:hypothetical protein
MPGKTTLGHIALFSMSTFLMKTLFMYRAGSFERPEELSAKGTKSELRFDNRICLEQSRTYRLVQFR